MSTPTLPRRSASQVIGELANEALRMHKPDGWMINPLSAEHDYGIDLHIQVEKRGYVQYPFRAQVKGSAEDASSQDKSYFSVPLRVSTSTYLKRSDLVMLVYVDLSADRRPENANVYYAWLNEVLPDRLKELEASGEEQVEITIRVPSSQQITKTLDICPYLDREMQKRDSMTALNKAITGADVAIAPELRAETLASNVRQGGAAFLEATLGESGFPWPEAKPGTNSWLLKQLRDAIANGIEQEALDLEKRVLRLTLRDDIELAECAFQRGRLAILSGRHADAVRLYAEAAAINPKSPRFECARIEASLGVEKHSDVANREMPKLATSEYANDPRIMALRGRLHIVLDQFPEAAAILDALDPKDAILEQVLLATMTHDGGRVAALIEQAQALNVPRQTRLSVKILAARSLFWDTFQVPSGEPIPPTGPPQLDVSRLAECWRVISELGTELKSSRWPVNSGLLIEILGAVAIAANKAAEALALVDDFLRERPHEFEYQQLRMRLAVYADSFDIARLAAQKLPNADSRTVHEVLLSYAAGEHQSAVDCVRSLLAAPDDADPMLGEALLVAAVCADRLFRTHESDACIARLRALPGAEERLAVYRFVSKASAGKDSFEEGLAGLRAEHEKTRNSTIIQDHLITALRPSIKEESELSLRLAGDIAARRLLFGQEVVHVARCLEALGRRPEAMAELERASKRLPSDVEISAMRALLYEKDGDSARALELLGSVIGANSRMAERCRTSYINVAARNGLTDLAVKQFEALYSRTTDRKEKADILRGIFSLELHRGAKSDRLTTLAFAYGALADQTDEFEEGMFLQFVLTAGLTAEAPLPADKQDEFSKRSEKFFSTYPNSRYVSVLQVPKDASAREFLAEVRRKIGLTEDQIVAFERHWNELERGSLIVPYAWRPRIFLQNVATVSQLWELTKRSSHGSRAFNLMMSPTRREGRDLGAFRQVPLLDLPTLLVLTELNLWKVALAIFDRIAISKWTLLRIQTDASPIGYPTETVLRLRAAVRDDFGRIVEPGSVDEDWMKVRDCGLSDLKKIAEDSRFAFYSDDYLARLFVLGDDGAQEGLSTLDVLETAESRGLVSATEAAERIASLVSWNVASVPILYRHLLSAIPTAVDSARTADEKFEVLRSDPVFRPLVNAVWSVGKPYRDVAEHFTSVLARILNESPNVSEELAAAIFGLWFIKAVLRPDIPVAPELHLAYITTLVFLKVEDRQLTLRKLWNVYRYVVELRHGDRMDAEVERKAFTVVGEAVSRIGKRIGNHAELERFAEKIAKGLTPGLPDVDRFWRGFRERSN